MSARSLLKSLIPPLFIQIFRAFCPQTHGWEHGFSSWSEAKAKSVGYDTDDIVRKVTEASLAVKDGNASYERDGVLFYDDAISWPIISAIALVLAKSDFSKVNVIDFGGSLGSTYFQNRKVLRHLNLDSWCVVEQEKFVTTGVELFQDDILKFSSSVDDCILSDRMNAVLLSSVLQYLDDPYAVLSKIISNRPHCIILDRTIFSTKNKEEYRIQIVPQHIYNASYPCRLFSQSELFRFFDNNGYQLLTDFDAIDIDRDGFYFKGAVFINEQ